MNNSSIFKILIFYFALYPLFAIFAFKVLGNAPGNITGLLLILLILYIFITTKTLEYSHYLVFYFLFLVYVTALNFIKLGIDISPIKFLYTYKNLHFFIFLVFLQLKIRRVNVNIRLIYNIVFFTVILSVIVIIIQQFSPIFFVNQDFLESWMIAKDGDLYVNEELRSPSIYSWSGTMGIGLIFIPFVAILVNKYIIEKKIILVYGFLLLGLLLAILCKGRWVMVNALILFLMVFHYNKLGIKRVLKIVFGLASIFILISYILPLVGINIENLIAERILETNRGGLTEGSASTRLFAFEIFFKLFFNEPIFGAGAQITDELLKELGGRSSQIHVGFLSLFFYYGLIGGLLYLGFVFYLTKTLYRNSRIHGYYAPLYSWIGFLLANLTLNYLIPFEAGILLVLLLDKYYIITQKEKETIQLMKPIL